jgi:large conductance mechanosensitive channel
VAIVFGADLNTLTQFVMISLAIFIVVRLVNRVFERNKDDPSPPAPAPDVVLLTEIRDLLKAREAAPRP